MSIMREMDDIYKYVPPDKIPWNVESPPEALVELVDKGKIVPCKTLDIGCGAGNYSIYLACRGFDVTGIDISHAAIELAKANAQKKGVACNFIVADVLACSPGISETFDFAYDWEVLHHVFPENREKFIMNVKRLMNPGGQYLSVCFNVNDPCFDGTGKYRQTPMGTVLYFSSLEELRMLYEICFKIQELKTLNIKGKRMELVLNYALMIKK
jgi:cyclopropane fatty-acyl-phospholipid synthase-like methyltransferase